MLSYEDVPSSRHLTRPIQLAAVSRYLVPLPSSSPSKTFFLGSSASPILGIPKYSWNLHAPLLWAPKGGEYSRAVEGWVWVGLGTPGGGARNSLEQRGPRSNRMDQGTTRTEEQRGPRTRGGEALRTRTYFELWNGMTCDCDSSRYRIPDTSLRLAVPCSSFSRITSTYPSVLPDLRIFPISTDF